MIDKLEALKKIIRRYPSALIAYSGGVDSVFLAHVAGEVLGKKVLLVTASSSTYPLSEQKEAEQLAVTLGLPHRIIVSEAAEIDGFADNTLKRCYFCKRMLFGTLTALAEKEGYAVVFDGSNADDLGDYRPGRKALKELKIISPLCEAGLTKPEIREFSRERGLPTADKPSYACLASRFPYGEKITKEKLNRVERAEDELKRLGFRRFRVRSHQDLARIEVAPPEMELAWNKRSEMHDAVKACGFTFVALDLQGYRTGAMNEALGR
ncbi:MAG: ATP-dependent sacrificial sulfur transferase LarE [Chitinispirillaceae bacterium]|nr:ATP-dependent sacrificial sulfur transferase LarE [Chitinispirillaceae bacterium]